MVLDAISKRRSIRAYKSDDVSDDKIVEIIKAAQFAPTAYGKGAIEYIVIRDNKSKEEIFNIVDQEYIKSAPVLIIPVATVEVALPEIDLSISSAHIFLQAAELGLGTVWKHLMPEWAEAVKQLLQIPAAFKIINIIPVGFSAEEKVARSEEDFRYEKIHTEKW